MKADHVAAIEAGYRLDGAEESWLLDIAKSAEPLFGANLGLLAWTFEVTAAGKIVLPTRIGTGAREFVSDLEAGHQTADPSEIVKIHLAGPCWSTSEILGPAWMRADPYRQRCCERYGFDDLINIVAGDPTGRGVGMSVPVPEPARTTVAMRRRWSRLVAHWVAAYRARRAFAAAGGGPTAALDSAEAVLTPGGRVAHAEGAAKGARAREALRGAARAVDQARGRLRRSDPDAAIELWQALFAGRWSLMDVFDGDGRRFVVARRNDPGAPAGGGLSTREFQVLAYRAQAHPLKLIAYECGLSLGTVAGYLRSACNKLGVKTPMEIARIFTQGR